MLRRSSQCNRQRHSQRNSQRSRHSEKQSRTRIHGKSAETTLIISHHMGKLSPTVPDLFSVRARIACSLRSFTRCDVREMATRLCVVQTGHGKEKSQTIVDAEQVYSARICSNARICKKRDWVENIRELSRVGFAVRPHYRSVCTLSPLECTQFQQHLCRKLDQNCSSLKQKQRKREREKRRTKISSATRQPNSWAPDEMHISSAAPRNSLQLSRRPSRHLVRR